MRTTTARSNQSIPDLAIQHCGSIEAVYPICVLNSLNIDAELTPGQVIILPEIVDKKVVDLFKERGVEPATKDNNIEVKIGVFSDYEEFEVDAASFRTDDETFYFSNKNDFITRSLPKGSWVTIKVTTYNLISNVTINGVDGDYNETQTPEFLNIYDILIENINESIEVKFIGITAP